MTTTSNRKAARKLIRSFLNDENGATAIEYSLIVGLLFLVIIGAVRQLEGSMSDMYNEIDTEVSAVIE